MCTETDRKSSGFSLLELMVALVIFSILAVIAVPLYTQQVRNSQRAAAESQMLQLAGDLERWRGKNFLYQGFTPTNGYSTVSGPTANTAILLPVGSTQSNYQYMITLVDSASRSSSLVPVTTSTAISIVGQNWTMIARPFTGGTDLTDTNTPTSFMGSASRLVLNNHGVRCMTPGTAADRISDATIKDMTVTDAGLCGSSSTGW